MRIQPWDYLSAKAKTMSLPDTPLSQATSPWGVSEYELSKLYPADFKSSLPTIEELERELNRDNL